MNSRGISVRRIPETWIWTTIQEISSGIQYGYTASACNEGTGPKFLRITDIQNGSVDWDNVPTCRITKEDSKKFRLNIGDIVFARTGATVGKSYLILEGSPESVFASYLIRIALPDDLNRKYVYYFFQSPQYWKQISEGKAGIGQPNVNATKLQSLKIPLPPLSEQHRIVSKIEELFTKLDAGIEALRKAEAFLASYRKAIMRCAFEGKLTECWRQKHKTSLESGSALIQRVLNLRRNLCKLKKYKEPCGPIICDLPELPEGWVWATADQISTKVVDGVHKKPDYVPDGIPFITVRNLTSDEGISFKHTKYVSKEDHQRFQLRANPEKGDILITKDGTLGVSRVIKSNEPFSIFVSVAMIKTIKSELNSDYLSAFIASPLGQQQVKRMGEGSGLQHLHLEDLRTLAFPIPPYMEQCVIADLLSTYSSALKRLEETIQGSEEEAIRIKRGILEKAFQGELVPQGPSKGVGEGSNPQEGNKRGVRNGK